jgi:succinate dehydrogenase flavin-adding protein (antitoxin of CptAB toxin-antitoxin module)
MKTVTDKMGKTLTKDEIEELALGNIIASMSVKELAQTYLLTQNDADILQWATDEEGNFPQ